MFRVLSSRFILTPRLSFRRNNDGKRPKEQRVDLATATKRGDSHGNEDRAVLLLSLASVDASKEDTSSEASSNTLLDYDDIRYIAVFDGHCGAECSQFMAANLHRHILKHARSVKCSTFEDIKFILPDAFKTADEEFCAIDPKNISGSCGVVALIHGSEILVAHVGDCRAVLRCNNKTTRLTRDHRPSNQEEIKRVTASGGHIVNGRIGGVMSPTRSFGDMDVREEFGEGILISEPEIAYATLEREEESSRVQSSTSAAPSSPSPQGAVFLLLGSDGIFDEISSDEACKAIEASLLRTPGDVRRAVERLVKLAASKTTDDCTAALAVWSGPDPETPSRVISKKFDFAHFDEIVPITPMNPSPTSS